MIFNLYATVNFFFLTDQLTLALESWCEVRNQYPFCQKSSDGWGKDEARLLVGISNFCYSLHLHGRLCSRLCLSVHLLPLCLLNWLTLTLFSCMCPMGHYHGSQGIEAEDHGSRSRRGRSDLDSQSRTVFEFCNAIGWMTGEDKPVQVIPRGSLSDEEEKPKGTELANPG